MFHKIEFRLRGLAELETPGKSNLEQLVIKQGTRLNTEIKPYVVEGRRGPVEVADYLVVEVSAVFRSGLLPPLGRARRPRRIRFRPERLAGEFRLADDGLRGPDAVVARHRRAV